MARICKCHRNVQAAREAGMDFYEAYALHAKPGYHEHRCECGCGCKQDTLGYAYCPYCHFEHAKLRGERIGILGLPFKDNEP